MLFSLSTPPLNTSWYVWVSHICRNEKRIIRAFTKSKNKLCFPDLVESSLQRAFHYIVFSGTHIDIAIVSTRSLWINGSNSPKHFWQLKDKRKLTFQLLRSIYYVSPWCPLSFCNFAGSPRQLFFYPFLLPIEVCLQRA